MRRIVKVFRRPPAVRMPDRNGNFPRLSDGVAHGFRCSTSPRPGVAGAPPAFIEPGGHPPWPPGALLAENLGKPSLGVIIKDLWY